jgi:uncharacterized protein YndB with AHSA1/START domain
VADYTVTSGKVMKNEVQPKNKEETTFTVDRDKLEVLVEATINAPREKVFTAYVDPQLIVKWWGPRILENKIDAFDAKPGGRWRIIQKGHDAKEYAFNGVYKEVTRPKRIIRTFEYEGNKGKILNETVAFTENKGKTRITNKSHYPSLETLNEMVAAKMEWGARESMERLSELLQN